MALTKAQVREILSAAGVDTEHISAATDRIIEGHTESIEALRDERDALKQYKADAEKLPAVQKELDGLKAEAAKAAGQDYAALKQEFDDYKTEVEAEKRRAGIAAAYTELLKDAGITSEKAIAKVLKYTDLDAMELDGNGKIKGAKDKIKEAREEWPELVSTTRTQGAETETPPENSGGSGFGAMSLAEKMRYANEHPGDESVKAWLASDLAKQNDKG